MKTCGKRAAGGLSLLLLASSCGAGVGPPRASNGHWYLPGRAGSYRVEDQNTPEARLGQIKQNFLDSAGNHHRAHPGLDALRYPNTRSLAFAWAYEALAADFERAAQPAAAAHAYWAALGLSGSAFGSRPDRERLRQHSFQALQRLAEARGEKRWAELLGFAADLAGTYLSSGSAERDHDGFYAHFEGLVQEEQRAQQARFEAQRALEQQRLANMSGSLNFQSAVQSGSMALQDAFQQAAGLIKDTIETEIQAGEINDAFKESLAALGADAGELRQVAAKDIPEILAGKSFVGQQFLFYVAASGDDPHPYLSLFRRFAQDEVELSKAFGRNASRSNVLKLAAGLAKGLQEVEIYVSTFERNGAIPGPKYLAEACATPSVRCELARQDLCGRGIEVACQQLRSDLEARCAEGSAAHCRVLATSLQVGTAMRRDPIRARSLLTRACDAADGLACAQLEVVLTETGSTAASALRAREAKEHACALGIRESCED